MKMSSEIGSVQW